MLKLHRVYVHKQSYNIIPGHSAADTFLDGIVQNQKYNPALVNNFRGCCIHLIMKIQDAQTKYLHKICECAVPVKSIRAKPYEPKKMYLKYMTNNCMKYSNITVCNYIQ